MSHEIAASEPGNPILRLLGEAMTRRLGKGARNRNIDYDMDLIEYGVVDSQGLLDLILEVETHSNRMFDAERIDFEGGVTLRRIAEAFG